MPLGGALNTNRCLLCAPLSHCLRCCQQGSLPWMLVSWARPRCRCRCRSHCPPERGHQQLCAAALAVPPGELAAPRAAHSRCCCLVQPHELASPAQQGKLICKACLCRQLVVLLQYDIKLLHAARNSALWLCRNDTHCSEVLIQTTHAAQDISVAAAVGHCSLQAFSAAFPEISCPRLSGPQSPPVAGTLSKVGQNCIVVSNGCTSPAGSQKLRGDVTCIETLQLAQFGSHSQPIGRRSTLLAPVDCTCNAQFVAFSTASAFRRNLHTTS